MLLDRVGPGLVYDQIRQALEGKGWLEKFIYKTESDPCEFDSWASRRVEPCDLFIGGSGGFLTQIRRAHELRAKVLLVRFSTHHLNQRRVLSAWYRLFGREVIPDALLEMALKEYEEMDHLLAVSEFAKRTYLEYGVPEDKVSVVHLGVDLERFPYREPRPEPFRVLFVGTNPVRKGLQHLLEAWNSSDIDGELVVRSGYCFGKTKRTVHIPQHVPNLEGLYNQCSVYILPSLEEGFPLTCLEAMAASMPIIVSDACGTVDIIKHMHEGIVIPTGDVEKIAEAIKYFSDSPEEITRMGRNARRTAEQYPWERFRDRIIEICGGVVG